MDHDIKKNITNGLIIDTKLIEQLKPEIMSGRSVATANEAS